MNVGVAVPLGNNVTAAAFNAFMAIAQRGWPLLQRGSSRTDVNRNEFGKMLLAEPQLDYLLMLDADHLHPPDIVERLIRIVRHDPSRLIVGGLNFRRREPHEPLVWVKLDDGLYHYPVEIPDGIFKCDVIAHGSLLLHRSVLERIEYPWWRYDYSIGIDDEFPTEDIYFCKRAREAGIEIWCDPFTVSPHLASREITGANFEQYIAEHPEQFVIQEQEVA